MIVIFTLLVCAGVFVVQAWVLPLLLMVLGIPFIMPSHLVVRTIPSYVSNSDRDQFPVTSADYPQLKPLLASTAKRFNVEQVSAARAYIGHDNLEAIGTFPLIPFKAKSVRVGVHGKSAESRALWRRMHDFFTHNCAECGTTISGRTSRRPST